MLRQAIPNLQRFLLQCPVTDPELARRWRILRVFVFLGVGLGIPSSMADGQWTLRTTYSLVTIGILSVVYLIAQAGHIRTAAWAFVLSVSLPTALGIFQTVADPINNPYVSLYFFLIGIAGSGVLLSWRSVLGISLALTAYALILALWGIEYAGGPPLLGERNGVTFLISMSMAYLVVSLLAVYSSWAMDWAASELRVRSAAEAKAEEAQRAAEAASQAKSLFLANMSHELRTPLTTILGYAEMLHEEAVAERQTRLISDLGRIETAGKHLLAMINDVLDLAKIEAGKMDVFVETFLLSALLSEADLGSTVRPLMESNENRLEIHIGSGLMEMRTDLTKLRQVLINLLSNAAKFTKQGTVTLGAGRHPDKAGWIRFSVRDTGIGMSVEQLSTLFQPFEQGDSSTTKRYGGTGLGLALSRNLCRLLGGDIEAESVLGVGSCFTVSLPLLMPEPVQRESLLPPRDVNSSRSSEISVTLPLQKRVS